MAKREAQQPTRAGLAATYHTASAGGDQVPPGSYVHVKNTNAAALTVTYVTPGTTEGDLTIQDPTSDAVPATTGDRFLNIPKGQAYRDVDGYVGLSWSVTSGVTFAVLAH